VITFTIKKRINPKLFIDKMAALYLASIWIRGVTNQSYWSAVLVDWRSSISGGEVLSRYQKRW